MRMTFLALSIIISLVLPQLGESAGAGKDFLIQFQGEDFDDAAHHPDWNIRPGQGWYSMEMKHCNGYAVAICDTQSVGASMSYSLKKSIPPGKYRFFLHIIKMRSGGKNGLEITIGDQTWKVIWDGSTYKIRDYAIDAHDFILTKPANRIVFRSLLIERWSIGDVPEHPIPTIMIDRIMVTGDLRQQVIKAGRRQEVGLPEEVKAATAAKKTSKTKTKIGAIASGNRIANGSFEVANTTTWFGNCSYRHGIYALRPKNRVKEKPVHGEWCLDIPASGFGVFSEMFRGVSGEPVEVSLHLRSSTPVTVRLSVISSKDIYGVNLSPKGVKVTGEWQKISKNVKLPADASGRYYLQVSIDTPERSSDLSAKIWLDAASVSTKARAEYESRDLHEAGLSSDKVANIYHDRNRVEALLSLSNHDRKTWNTRLELVIRDHRNLVVGRKPITMKCASGKSLRQATDISCGRWGIFSAIVHDKAAGKDLGEISYIVIPKRERKTPGMCGFYGQTGDPWTMAIFKELGVGWNGTLADGWTRHIGGPKDFDQIANNLAVSAKHGVKIQYATEILYHKQQKNLHYEGTRGRHHHPPSVAGLEKDLFEFARRLKNDVAVWNLQDETANFKIPVDVYPLYHKVATDAIRRADPDAVVIVSSEPEFQEQVLKVLGRDYLDAICDAAFSPGGGARYRHEPFAELAREWKLPLWFSGFGFTTRTMYRTRAEIMGYRPEDSNYNYRSPVDRAAAAITVNRLDFGATRFVLYSAIPSILNPYRLRPTNIYDFDGTVNNVAASYAAICAFLEDASDGKKLETPHEDLSSYAFRLNDEDWLTFWVDPGLNYGNIRYGKYTLDIDLKGELLDSFGNPYEATVEGTTTSVQFEGQPLYFRLGKTGHDKIATAIKNARYTVMFALRGFCVGDAEGGTSFRIVAANHSKQSMKGTLVISESRGIFPEEGRIERNVKKLKPGKKIELDIACCDGLAVRRPLTQGSASASFGGGRYSSSFGIWSMPAQSVGNSPKLDGRLDDWKGIAPAFIYTTHRASGGYQLMQVRRGTGHIRDQHDTGCSIFVQWDQQNLYLALKVQDDDLQFPKNEKEPGKGDQLTVCIDADLSGDLFDSKMSEDDFLISIKFAAESLQVTLVDSNGQRSPLGAAHALVKSGLENGYVVELVCPWDKLGVRPRPGTTLGFDTTLYDADGSPDIQTESAWAGFNSGLLNPTGWGQLILR